VSEDMTIIAEAVAVNEEIVIITEAVAAVIDVINDPQ
jgi:hypothetical protein